MAKESPNAADARVFAINADWMKEAHSIADAASARAATGNQDGALRMFQNIEELTTDVSTLPNAACLLRRERED